MHTGERPEKQKNIKIIFLIIRSRC